MPSKRPAPHGPPHPEVPRRPKLGPRPWNETMEGQCGAGQAQRAGLACQAACVLHAGSNPPEGSADSCAPIRLRSPSLGLCVNATALKRH